MQLLEELVPTWSVFSGPELCHFVCSMHVLP
jgi:hypothetical protein